MEMTIAYNGSTLKTVTDSGTTTLNTAGKFLTGDVTLTVDASGGGGFTIDVTAPTGSIVVATKGSTTCTATENSGTWRIDLTEEGTWTVTATKGTDSTSETITVPPELELSYVNTTLENNTWATISRVAQAGTGDTYWDVGDTKTITLNGAIGAGLTLSNTSLNVFILDFNHVDNGVADNNIIFGGFKTSGGVDVALVDSKYNTATYSGKYLNMNHWGSSSNYNTNYGGWKGCDLRYDILGGTSTQPSGYGSTKTTSCVGYDATSATITTPVSSTLMAALPSDFRNVLRLHTHYVDNTGNKSNVDANVTAVVDAIFLLAEFEVFGAKSGANQYEQNHQTQMTYYSQGNSKIKYKHNATSTACFWWCSSPTSSTAYNFRSVYASGSSNNGSACNPLGLAPAFKL